MNILTGRWLYNKRIPTTKVAFVCTHALLVSLSATILLHVRTGNFGMSASSLLPILASSFESQPEVHQVAIRSVLNRSYSVSTSSAPYFSSRNFA